MKNVPMRFAGYTFRHNPSKLTIEDAANMMQLISPLTAPDSRYLGKELRIIRGEGELYGADCLLQYRALAALYERGEKGLLSLPGLAPMPAYFRELKLLAENREDVISFRFTFIEAQGELCPLTSENVYTVTQDGESLWEIAYRHDADIDTLVRLNPQIGFIAHLTAGEKVRLC